VSARAFVALGSNLGDRRAQLERAIERLAAAPTTRVYRVSPWIETEPVGGPPGQPRYLNGVAELDTELTPRELLDALLAIEREAGRIRGERDGPRTLDLDLLLYDDVVIDTLELQVPHPRMEEREFVLEPLARIAPRLRLPRSRRTVAERLAELRAERARTA
jgi:2-amino-4-hydroxy-6-hydroxymethyldihydropteridine diphosphokinase